MGIPTKFNPLGINKDEGGGGMPTEGLVFYMPLNNATTFTAEEGITINEGSVPITFSSVDSIQCGLFDNINKYISIKGLTSDNFPYGSQPRTFSIWVNFNVHSTGSQTILWYGASSGNGNCICMTTANGNYITVDMYNTGIDQNIISGTKSFPTINDWHHLAITMWQDASLNKARGKLYIDGEVMYEGYSNYALNTSRNYNYANIGGLSPQINWSRTADAYLAAARIYNRVLTDEEITTLANELHPLKYITFNNQSISFSYDKGSAQKALKFTAPYSGYSFTINSGTLPAGVSFNTSTGVFTYDGSEITEDEDIELNITCSGQYMTPATATVTLKMRVEEEIPSDFVFYAKLDNVSIAQIETGQAVTHSNGIDNYLTAKTIAGLDCIECSINSHTARRGWLIEDTNMPSGNSPRTISVWINPYNDENSNVDRNGYEIIKWGPYDGIRDTWNRLIVHMIDKAWSSYSWWSQWPNSSTYLKNHWTHFTFTFNGEQIKIYENGSNVATVNDVSLDTVVGESDSGVWIFGGSAANYWHGALTSLRVYNRVLDAEEILNLSQEFSPHYTITANDLSCSFYQKNETFGISYNSPMTPTFEIIEGTLPSTITFNTSNGQFTGKGLTDDDHTYNLKVRITADSSDSAECNVIIRTYKTARISISGKTFTFYTDGSANDTFSYTSDEAVSFAIDSGTLPTGITLSSNRFYSDGSTPVGSYSVVVRGTSTNNQTGVTATMRFNVIANVITISTSSLKFFVDKGQTTKKVVYSTDHYAITPIYSMTGTLPTGITFNSATGEFTSDATQSAATSGSVQVTVASSTGYSTPATKNVDLIVEMVSPPIPDDYILYWDMLDKNATSTNTGQPIVEFSSVRTKLENTTLQGIQCIKSNNNSRDSRLQFNSITNELALINKPRTVSAWGYIESMSHTLMVGLGQDGASRGKWNRISFMGWGIDYAYSGGPGEFTTSTERDAMLNGWHNHCYVYDGNRHWKYYLDGVFVSERSASADSNIDATYCKVFGDNWDNYFVGYECALRIYDRVLTDEEIAQLAAEFTPTP